jgi:hypothetical protein
MRFVVAAAVGLLVAGGIAALRLPRETPASGSPARESGDRTAPPAKTSQSSTSQPGAKTAAAVAAQPSVKTERDPVVVFQRAFWRRPAAGDRVLHGERHEWLDASSAVQRWQWFVAVEASAALREWLLKDNPFELVRADSGAMPELATPPAWFPAPSALRDFAFYRHREGRFLVFHDTKTNRIFATDSGGGFAMANK